MAFSSQGYGGRTMTKTILVRTDDPDTPTLNLVLTGQVEPVVQIDPHAVYLNGTVGDTLEALVSITPSEAYPFAILGLSKRHNTRIETRLIPPEKGGKTWNLVVGCRSDKAENIYEVLILNTDSDIRPTLEIRVSILFAEKRRPF